MTGETQSPLEASRDSNLEISRSLRVKEFVLQSLTADLEQKAEFLPGTLKEKGLRLAKRFQQGFIELITDSAQNISLTNNQMTFLRRTILSALSFDYKQTSGEVSMDQNAKDLLIAATYINSLNPPER